MRKVELTMNEQKKYEVIKKLCDANGNKKRAAVELNCSTRHVNRMIKGYKEYGKAYFSHGNKGRKPATAIPEETKKAILLLYENKYQGANIRHFTELLKKHEDIHVSEGSVRNIFREAFMLSPKAWKRTRRALAKELLK